MKRKRAAALGQVWTSQEDQHLLELATKNTGPGRWTSIAEKMGTRTRSAVMQRHHKLTNGVLNGKAPKATRRRQSVATPTPAPTLNYCPNCGCNIGLYAEAGALLATLPKSK